jgi:hypothetical protein
VSGVAGAERVARSRVAAPSQTSVARERVRGLWPLPVYAVLSVVLFGIPVLGHFASRVVASDAIDSSAFMWFFAWWPHALLHGLNPFITHVMFVPEGFNLTWATAMPGPSIVLSPITLAFGPAVTWNVIQLSCPALSAWTAFLLCGRLGCGTWPSLAGGYVFGFSPYMLVHLTGGPHLALVALLPVFVLLVLRRVQGTISRKRFVIWMSLALTAQYLISSEVLASATLLGATTLALAFALLPDRRATLLDTVKLLAVAYAATAVLISPFLYFFLVGRHHPPGATFFSADLASFALPPPLVALTRHGTPFAGASTEPYLGLPLIALICLFAWRRRRDRTTWLIVGPLAIAGILALGAHVFIRGRLTSIPAPWLVLEQLPILRYAIPVRLAVFVVLPAALIVGLWLRDGGAGRWALALLAIASIAPSIGSAAWNTPTTDPPFFSRGSYRAYLRASDNVLTVPAWGANERWQADTGFRFNLSDGYAGNPFPASYGRYPTWSTLLTGRLTPVYAIQLRRFLAAKHVTAIVVQDGVPGPWTTLFGTLGVAPVHSGGVLLYRLRRDR